MSVSFSSSRLTLVVIAVLKFSFAAHQATFKPTGHSDNTTELEPHYQVVRSANGVLRTDTIQSGLIQALRPHSSIVKTLESSPVTSQPPLLPKTKQLYDVIVKTARETRPSADVASLLTLLPAVELNDTSVTSTSDKRTATGASRPSLRGDVHVDVCASVCGACRAVLSLRWATLCDVECESDQQPPGQVLNACITLWSLQETAPPPPAQAPQVM